MFLIETARLVMRPVVDADAEQTARLMTADISDSLSSWPYPLGVEEARERIRRSAHMLEERQGTDFAITERSSAHLMGWIGLVLIGPKKAALGYWLGENFRRKGYGREAVQAFLPEAAALLGAKEIWAYTSETNARSIAVLEANDFSRQGVETRFVPMRGREEQLLKLSRTLDFAR